MCMTITKKYTGRGTKVVGAWKVFRQPRYGTTMLTSQYGRYSFTRGKWSYASRRPGFHAYKLQKDARRVAVYPAIVRKVYLKGLFGSSRTHYTAKYLRVR